MHLRGVIRGKLRNIDAVAISSFWYVNICDDFTRSVFTWGYCSVIDRILDVKDLRTKLQELVSLTLSHKAGSKMHSFMCF